MAETKTKSNTMNIKYYIVPIWSCIDPEPLKGPFNTYDGMLRAARKIRAKQNEEDGIFWLRIGEGNPMIQAFTMQELESRD